MVVSCLVSLRICTFLAFRGLILNYAIVDCVGNGDCIPTRADTLLRVVVASMIVAVSLGMMVLWSVALRSHRCHTGPGTVDWTASKTG